MSRQIKMLNITSHNVDLHYNTWITLKHISFKVIIFYASVLVMQSHNKGNLGEDNRQMTYNKSSRFRSKTVFTVCECLTFMFSIKLILFIWILHSEPKEVTWMSHETFLKL